MTSNLSRRAFLAATGAAATFSPLTSTQAATQPHLDRTIDVLVVGSGFAGLAAAIEAHSAGAKDVVVIEKMPIVGGNSILSGGGLAAPGNDLQVAAGISDSPELLLKDMLKSGGGLAHTDCARVVAFGALEAYRWAKNFLGVRFDRLGYQGGHSVARSACYMKGNGARMVAPMLQKLKEFQVPVLTQTRLVNLITENGRVIGAEVTEGFEFPHDQSGKKIKIRARKGVVIASGGFSQNIALRTLHDPRLGAQLESTNQPGATGDAMQAAQRIGAADVLMDWIQLGPWTSPDEKGFGVCPKFVESSVGYGLMIDPKTGKRFINETGNRKVRADAILAIGHPAILCTGEANLVKHVPPATVKAGMENGSIRKFSSFEELARGYGMEPQVVAQTLARWNKAIVDKKDPDFQAKIFADTVVNTAPFYACRLWPRVHYCMGGLAITPQAEVLSTDLKPIAGLFAAGEVTGGVHGMVRLGTVSIADCLVFGRIAGRNAAKG